MMQSGLSLPVAHRHVLLRNRLPMSLQQSVSMPTLLEFSKEIVVISRHLRRIPTPVLQ